MGDGGSGRVEAVTAQGIGYQTHREYYWHLLPGFQVVVVFIGFSGSQHNIYYKPYSRHAKCASMLE